MQVPQLSTAPGETGKPTEAIQVPDIFRGMPCVADLMILKALGPGLGMATLRMGYDILRGEPPELE
jgi:hypothetical protein